MLLLESFSHQHLLMVFHWRLSDSKSPQVSRTLFSFLSNLNNAIVWIVSARFEISKSSSPCINNLVNVGPAVRVFANGLGDLGSIPGRVIPKTLKMELDTTLLNTQHYKVRFKGKVEQSREWSSALPYTLVY